MVMWIMHCLVCLPQALVIHPGANNELTIWQQNLKDHISFPDATEFSPVNTGKIAAIEFNWICHASSLSALLDICKSLRKSKNFFKGGVELKQTSKTGGITIMKHNGK